jgi:hypothetical protein
LIHDRHGVCMRSHLTGPGHVPSGAHGLADPAVQRVIIGENGIRRVDTVLRYVFIDLL